jgi:ribosomal-protein-alanine N-acetyltransferase
MDAPADALATSFAIARANTLDLFGVWRLERACFDRDAYDILTLLGMSLSPKLHNLKVVADGKLVGYCSSDVKARDEAGWIITIGVHPAYQGHGIGAKLLAAAEDAMRPAMRRVKLTVRRSNARAIRLYERGGYKWITTYNRYYSDGEDGLVMEKIL